MRPMLSKNTISISVFSLLIALTFFWCNSSDRPRSSTAAEDYPLLPDAPVRNIIMFIGDGMGLSQITAYRIHNVGGEGKLNIERMPVTGLLHTQSIDDLITDSAAGATAMACGFKTRNGMIATLPDNTKVLSILEAARDKGMSTGLVATSSITHATPACFASHVESRGNQTEIARQLIEANVDILLGGGGGYFIPQSAPESKRSDDLNLVAQAQEKGYQFVETAEELLKTSQNRVLGLFRSGALKRESPEPTLAEMTAKSIELLSQNNEGFFLMVEGSQIDWGAHDNDLDYMLWEMASFDEAVKVGLDFALEDKHTLVVVTADHETGGLTINGGSFDGSDLEVGWTTGHHTGVPVPVFAFGPHSLRFTGVKENSEIPKIFADLLGIKPFPRKLN